MDKHLVFVGGGLAHLTALRHLGEHVKRGHQVTLVSPSPYHYYSPMGPGMLAGIYQPQQARVHLKRLAEGQGAAFLEDTATRIDPDKHLLLLSSGQELPYDVVSFDVGCETPTASLVRSEQANVFAAEPAANLLQVRRAILERCRHATVQAAIVGGGPEAVEIAGNIRRLVADVQGSSILRLFSASPLLDTLPDKARRCALESLRSRDVEVIEGRKVAWLEDGALGLSDGHIFRYDVAVVALAARPPSLFHDSGLPTGDDGGLLVNPCLQCVAHADILGGGDCITLESGPLARGTASALRQGRALHHNLMAAVGAFSPRPFRAKAAYPLTLSLGDGTAIRHRKGRVWHGRLAFWLKDHTDRRFMKRFQVSGERDEPPGSGQ